MSQQKLGIFWKSVHCFAQSSFDTIWGYFQLIFNLTSEDINQKYPTLLQLNIVQNTVLKWMDFRKPIHFDEKALFLLKIDFELAFKIVFQIKIYFSLKLTNWTKNSVLILLELSCSVSDLALKTLSISSINTTEGWWTRATAKSARTIFSPEKLKRLKAIYLTKNLFRNGWSTQFTRILMVLTEKNYYLHKTQNIIRQI